MTTEPESTTRTTPTTKKGATVTTVTTAWVEEGPFIVNGKSLDTGDPNLGKYAPMIRVKNGTKRAYFRLLGKSNLPDAISVEVPEKSPLRHFHIHAQKSGQNVAIAYYNSEEENTTCIRCGNSIVCGVNPSCGDPPDQ